MFYAAAQNKPYQCFLSEDTGLPMMHIDDLIHGTVTKLAIKMSDHIIDSIYGSRP